MNSPIKSILDKIPTDLLVPVITLVSAIVELIIHRDDAAKRQEIMFQTAEDLKAISDAEKFGTG